MDRAPTTAFDWSLVRSFLAVLDAGHPDVARRVLAGNSAPMHERGHFGHLQIGRARRPLMAFVMVLSSSRQIFLRFFLDARMDSFLRGHVEAFAAFAGPAGSSCTTT